MLWLALVLLVTTYFLPVSSDCQMSKWDSNSRRANVSAANTNAILLIAKLPKTFGRKCNMLRKTHPSSEGMCCVRRVSGGIVHFVWATYSAGAFSSKNFQRSKHDKAVCVQFAIFPRLQTPPSAQMDVWSMVWLILDLSRSQF